jgi:hypothetical protein
MLAGLTQRSAGEFARATLVFAGALLLVRAVWPAPANAVDLFPVDDWLGSGIKKAGDVVLGPLKLGVKEIAALLAAIVGALADLLIPKSLVESGIGGIKWLVQLPPVGTDATPQGGSPDVRMPHLQELRDTMTWIGVTLLPLGLVITAGRAFLVPTADGDSPADAVVRAISAGIALLLYDWAWGAVTELSRLLTSGILGLPWVADGVERMLETLLIGGASGSAVASEFVVPLMILVAGTALLGLLLVRVGLEVATALLYVLGGLVFGLSVTNLGRRLLSAWLVGAVAIVVLPLLWSTVFAVGAALMLDAGDAEGKGGLGAFVAQLYNVAAALAVFWIAIKLALGVFRHASGAITGITATPASAGAGRAASSGRVQALTRNATPAGLAKFSQGLRGAVGTASTFPVRHPVRTAHAGGAVLRHPVQSTHEAAGRLSSAMGRRGGDVRQEASAGLSQQADRGVVRPVPQGRGGTIRRGVSTATDVSVGDVEAPPPNRPVSRKRRRAAAQPLRSSSAPVPRQAAAGAPEGHRRADPTVAVPRDEVPSSGSGVTRPVWLRRPPKRDESEREDKR